MSEIASNQQMKRPKSFALCSGIGCSAGIGSVSNTTVTAPMRYRLLGMLAALLVLTGCVYHRMSAREMITDIQKIHHGGSAYINILWYNGSDEDYDYFGYVYGMLLGKNYKIPVGDFALERIPYTEDSAKFVPIREIERLWSAGRKHDGVWVEDKNGVSIAVNP